MRFTVLFVVGLLALTQGTTTWLVQNLYRTANNCDPAALAAASSWATGTCLKWNETAYNVKSCNRTHVTTQYCADAGCTICNQTVTYPANACGSITTSDGGQGIFFGCIEAPFPPTLSNVTNNVLNQYTYFNDNCSPTPVNSTSPIYQVLSYFSGWCLAGENRTCTADSATFTTPCQGGTPSAISLNVCAHTPINGHSFTSDNKCLIAEQPTTPPSDPSQPGQGADPNSVTACENAKTYEECIQGAPTSDNGKPTLPPTGLLNKCCVWCGMNNVTTGGGCRTPSFSTQLCTCNIPGSANFTDLVKGYGCPAEGTVQVDCKCTGKPLGAPYCVGASGLSALAAFVIVFVASAFFL